MSEFEAFGIRPEQGPPLSAPLAFFLTAPLAVVVAGALVIVNPEALAARGGQWTMGLTHLGTLGFLAAVMLGAVYQMLPVVAGSRVPWVRLSHGVHLALVIGLAALVYAFGALSSTAFMVAAYALAAAFVLFLGPVSLALIRAPVRSGTVGGMALATLGLIGGVAIGFWMAGVRADPRFVETWLVFTYVHMVLGGVVWVGGLIAAVSFQVVPMFYLADEYPSWVRFGTLGAIALTLVGVLGVATILAMVTVMAEGAARPWITVATIPGAAAVWCVHPLVTMRLLRNRRRRRVDESVRFWYLGTSSALLVPLLGAACWISADPRWPVALGWTAAWGWAGAIVHGMLSRIVPFLVWFHRYANLVGRVPVPPMARLLPAGHRRLMLSAHTATLVVGWAAIGTGWRWAGWMAGLGLLISGIAMLSGMLRVAGHLRKA